MLPPLGSVLTRGLLLRDYFVDTQPDASDAFLERDDLVLSAESFRAALELFLRRVS
jgi:hypothetical protein